MAGTGSTARWMALALVLALGCHRTPQRWESRRVDGGVVARYTFAAMDTFYTITVASRGEPSREALRKAFEGAESVVRGVERRMSYFIPSSDVGRINRSAGSPVTVSPETATVLRAAISISRKTRGAFDPTWARLKPLYRLKDPDWRPPSSQQISSALAHVGIDRISISGTTVRLTDPEARVDLGGIAKGYGVKKAYNYLKSLNFLGFIVDGGGDLCVHGTRPDRKWTVAVRDPFSPGELVTFAMGDGCVFTSGDYERYREVGGTRYTHVVDPRTGRTVDHVVSATVVGPDPVICDGLATALMVLGPGEWGPVLAGFPGYEALIVTHDRRVYHTRGMPGADEKELRARGMRSVMVLTP